MPPLRNAERRGGHLDAPAVNSIDIPQLGYHATRPTATPNDEHVERFQRYLRRESSADLYSRVSDCLAILDGCEASALYRLDCSTELEACRRLLAERRRWRSSGRSSNRIDESELDRIRQALPIAVALDRLGVQHERGRLRCLNPEHNDRHPSASIHPRENYVHCFACGWTSDVIGIVALAETLDFRSAVERCCRMIGGQS